MFKAETREPREGQTGYSSGRQLVARRSMVAHEVRKVGDYRLEDTE